MSDPHGLDADDLESTDDTLDPDEDLSSRPWWQPPSLFQAATMALALLLVGVGLALTVDTRNDNRQPSAVDEGFAQDMIIHHGQALQIASVAVQRATNQETRSFAQEVMIFQAREVGIMQTWLADWRRPEDGDRMSVMDWMNMPTKPEKMPGLATEVQLEELRAATGPDVDRLFYELMTTHHRGGIHMASYATRRGNEQRVTELARRMVQFQTVEIKEYAAAVKRIGL